MIRSDVPDTVTCRGSFIIGNSVAIESISNRVVTYKEFKASIEKMLLDLENSVEDVSPKGQTKDDIMVSIPPTEALLQVTFYSAKTDEDIRSETSYREEMEELTQSITDMMGKLDE